MSKFTLLFLLVLNVLMLHWSLFSSMRVSLLILKISLVGIKEKISLVGIKEKISLVGIKEKISLVGIKEKISLIGIKEKISKLQIQRFIVNLDIFLLISWRDVVNTSVWRKKTYWYYRLKDNASFEDLNIDYHSLSYQTFCETSGDVCFNHHNSCYSTYNTDEY